MAPAAYSVVMPFSFGHDRVAGVLLHVTSLPSSDLGPDAFRFVDYLAAAGQSAWQVLPLGPLGPGNSPYAARSAFAGEPVLISLEQLHQRGWLTGDEASQGRGPETACFDFERVLGLKEPLLRLAFGRALDSPECTEWLDAFEAAHPWVHRFAVFFALRQLSGLAWWEWETRFRSPEGVPERPNTALADEIRYQVFVQWCFATQWQALRDYAHGRGVSLIGDLPIFVDIDSADVWANQGMFKFERPGQLAVVSGVPPDAFSQTGQRWGNPVYDWDAMRVDGYRWWVPRFRRTLELFDAVRVDHFRGFEASWEIPAEAETAQSGHWVPGPGRPLFERIEVELGHLPLIVEDLGLITPEVRQLRDSLGYPGMVVLQFAFDGNAENPHLPHNHVQNSVVYTGTHDNDTTRGWFATRPDWERSNIQRYLSRDGSEIASDMIWLAYGSVAHTAIVPMQDILNLDSEARMNFPGTPTGNWRWRFTWDQVDAERTRWLRDAALASGRTPAEAVRAAG
jgi:4-alpha-glucanotransferase